MPISSKLSKNLIILAIGQALTSTTVSLLTTISALSGAFLAPAAYLSTVPVTATAFGALVMIYPASFLMNRLGRRIGFLLKAWIGILGGIVCCLGLWIGSFITLIIGTFLLGIFSAFGQYYRFAAIDAVSSQQEHAFAVGVVTSTGIAGGILGPFLGGRFAYSIDQAPYAGGFIALSLVCLLLALSQACLSSDLGKTASTPLKNHQTTPNALGKPFIYASLICAITYAVMVLTMHAAPLSLHQAGFRMHASSVVLQIHFAMMYGPSLLTPWLVQKIRLKGLVLLGILITATGCLLTILPEQTYSIYMIELAFSGIGWNFMFNGGTLLLAKTYAPDLRAKAQGLNSLIVYSGNIAASFSTGILLALFGWATVNLVGLPLLLFAVWALQKFKGITATSWTRRVEEKIKECKN